MRKRIRMLAAALAAALLLTVPAFAADTQTEPGVYNVTVESGYTLELVLSDGEEVSYAVDSSVPVTQNGDEVALSTQVDEGVYILDGSMSVAEFEHLLGLRVPEDFDCDTLGGFVTELLGDVPGDDSPTHSAHFGGVTFTVIHTDGKKIGKIRAVMKSKAN